MLDRYRSTGTHTLKLKRSLVADKYRDIEQLYME
jgi:hypothetical protein